MPALVTVPIKVRIKTSKKFREFGKRRRLKIVEVAELAIDALNSLPREHQDRLIEGGTLPPPPNPQP